METLNLHGATTPAAPLGMAHKCARGCHTGLRPRRLPVGAPRQRLHISATRGQELEEGLPKKPPYAPATPPACTRLTLTGCSPVQPCIQSACTLLTVQRGLSGLDTWTCASLTYSCLGPAKDEERHQKCACELYGGCCAGTSLWSSMWERKTPCRAWQRCTRSPWRRCLLLMKARRCMKLLEQFLIESSKLRNEST